MADIDDIVTDVEAQPTTRDAVGRLVTRLGNAYVEAIEEDTDGGMGFAQAAQRRAGDLTDAVIRVAEKPTGVEPGHAAPPVTAGAGYAQADQAFEQAKPEGQETSEAQETSEGDEGEGAPQSGFEGGYSPGSEGPTST